ncbi:MAG TPA: discoidin domain-containing protein, partial [Nonomuraea sp.]|nr:discoidin domain-containing protein [Nonomuraea sp.]
MRAVLAALALVIGLLAAPAWAADTNLAAGKTATAGSYTDVYPAPNVTDGNQATYWESANNAFPQWVQVDLGSAATVDQLTLKLPSGWPSRTQTLTVLGSANGTSFSTIKDAATYTFNPTATIAVSASGTRYVRLQITANSAWPAGQLSEFEVYGEAGGGGPGDGTNLTTGKPITESSHTHTYVAANANDGNVQTYWEGAAYPNTLTVQLGANADLTSIVLKLNPDPAWATRTQTIQVLGREQSATGLS